MTLSLEEGKKTWENAKKENIELRAKAELDVLKMQRMEDRIRILEAALAHSNVEDPRGNGYDLQAKVRLLKRVTAHAESIVTFEN